MARAAGNSSHYRVGIVDGDGKLRSEAIGFPSVTTVLGALPKGDGLAWWGTKIGVAGVLDCCLQPGFSLDGHDVESLYAEVKARKVHTPYIALKEAATRGTTIHDAAETLLRGETPKNVAPELQGYIDALQAWYDEENISNHKMIAIESPLFSLKYGYAGTCDAIHKAAFTTYVDDFKTSKAIHDSHLIQGVAYEQAAKEMGIIPWDAQVESRVIRLGIEGDYEIQISPYSLDDFLKVFDVWKLLQEKGMK